MCIVAAIGSAVSGIAGAVGASSAANTQADAQKQASATQQAMFNTIQGQERPFMNAGVAATNALESGLGLAGNKNAAGFGSLTAPFTAQDYLNNQDPGYQFQLQTGAQALRNSETPGVGSLSGQSLKDLMSFNQNMAATGYQNAFNRYQTQQNNTFSRLSGLAGLGQNAASDTGTAGTALGTGIAQSQAAAGASQAAGTLGVANAIGGSANSLGGLASLYLNGGTSSSPYGGSVTAPSGINFDGSGGS